MNMFKHFVLPLLVGVAAFVLAVALLRTFAAPDPCPCPAPLPAPAPPAPKPDGVPVPLPGPIVQILDFYADWCGPCRASKPAVDTLEREGYVIIRKDVETQSGKVWQRSHKVTSLPTFLVFIDGAEELRTGDATELRDWLHKHHPLRKK